MYGGAIFGAEYFGEAGVSLLEAPNYCLVSAITRLAPTMSATRGDPTLSALAIAPSPAFTRLGPSLTVTRVLIP